MQVVQFWLCAEPNHPWVTFGPTGFQDLESFIITAQRHTGHRDEIGLYVSLGRLPLDFAQDAFGFVSLSRRNQPETELIFGQG